MTKLLHQLFAALVVVGLAAVVPAHAQQRATPGRSCGTTANNEAMQQELERLNPAYNRNARPAPAAGFQRPAVAWYLLLTYGALGWLAAVLATYGWMSLRLWTV